MYITPNYVSKAAAKRAIAAGETVTAFQPGYGPEAPANGTVSVEGPHYPEPHRWHGQATITNGRVTAIK